MIKNSYIFLEGIGKKKEKQIQEQCLSWDDFLKKDIKGIGKKQKLMYNLQIKKAKKQLYNLNSSFFEMGPENWRLYKFFKDEAVFLDIEMDRKDLTVIGLFDGIETKTMIMGKNLDINVLKNELKKYKLIVTYNGKIHDIPFIKKRYPDLIPEVPCFDLRTACKRLGFEGGLKNIEKKLNIKRRSIIGKIKSGDPLTLYRMWKNSGDEHYLKLLVEYNEEDVINLKKIADYCYKQLTELIF